MDHPLRAPVHVLFCLTPRCKTWTHTLPHTSPRLVATGPHVKSWTATFPLVHQTCRTRARISDPDTPVQQGARRSDCLSEGEVAPCCQHLLTGLHMSGAGHIFFAPARFHLSAFRLCVQLRPACQYRGILTEETWAQNVSFCSHGSLVSVPGPLFLRKLAATWR